MSPLGGNGSHWDGCWDSHFDCAQKRIAALESQLAALKEPPTDGDAAYWHTAWKVLEAELQAKTAEVDGLRVCGNCKRQYWDGSTFECELNPCGDDIADEPNDDVSPNARCNFSPSEWLGFTPRPSQGGGE